MKLDRDQVQDDESFNPPFIDNVIKKVRYQLKAVAENAGILRCALNDTPLWPPCYPAWEMMEGEAVEIFALTFNYHNPKVALTALKKIFVTNRIEPLCYRHLNFDELIRHQFQALIVCFFIIKNKEERPSAASRCKSAQRVKPTYSYNYYKHLVIDTTKQSPLQISSMEIA